ncbi:hypothetical protein D3C86_1288910 [compost metagenome]
MRTDDPSSGLNHFLYAGIKVGVVITGTENRGHAPFQLLVHRIELRQPQRGDKRADQPGAGQVDAFPKGPAQHRKADTLAVGMELIEKLLTLRFAHASGLRPQTDVRMFLGQQLRDLLQIIETAEKRQVIAGALAELSGDQVHDRLQRRLAMHEPRGDLVDDMHLQLIGVKRRLDVDAYRVRRCSQ